MATYEASISLSHISTSGKARKGLSKADAVATAKAHLRYITREDAAEPDNVIVWSNGSLCDGDIDEKRALIKAAIDQRAERHNDAYGVRVFDKLMVSLPNDCTPEEQRQIVTDICAEFCGDSEASAIASIHTDKPGNKHAHIGFVDAKESLAAAKARRPDAKRVRRADHLRLNEGGTRKDVRQRVASCINEVASFNGRRLAEVRSYADRGIDREPQKHEGPQVSDKLDRPGDKITKGVFARLKENAVKLRKRLERETPEGSSILPDSIPSRWRKGWVGQSFSSWLQAANRLRTAGQNVSTVSLVDNQVAAFVADWPQQSPHTVIEPVAKPQEPRPRRDHTKALLREAQQMERVRRENDERQRQQPLQKQKRKRRQLER